MRFLLSVVLFVLLSGCGNRSAADTAAKHYPFSGKVLSLNAKDHTASIDGAAVPGYMDAMTMDYPIKSPGDFAKLHTGDKITATIDVSSDGAYSLSNIKIQAPAK